MAKNGKNGSTYPVLPYLVKCDCTPRATKFAVKATDSIFDAEYISHGQPTASPSGSNLLQWNIENRVPSLTFVWGKLLL